MIRRYQRMTGQVAPYTERMMAPLRAGEKAQIKGRNALQIGPRKKPITKATLSASEAPI